MLKSALYWAIMLVAALAVGPAAGALVGHLRAADGAGHVTPLTSATPILGLGAGVVALAIAVAAALLTARVLGTRAAMTVAGLVAAWIAFRTAQPDELVKRTQSGAVVWPLAIEGLLFGLLGALGAYTILRCGERQQDEAPVLSEEGPKAVGAGALAALAVGGVIAYFVAFQTLKLQTIFAASFAGIGAGAAAALACSSVDNSRPSVFRATLAAFLGMALLGTLGPATALVVNSRPGALLASAYSGTFFPLAAPVSFDWIAGAFLGVPIGIGWASTTLDKRSHARG